MTKKLRLENGFVDDEGVQGYVDVAYTNAVSFDAATTLRAARTPGKAASEREEHKRKRYPPEHHPHAALIPFVVEARGRLGAEVLPFLKQHAPAEEPRRSAVLARALHDISIITQQGLAALLLASRGPPRCSRLRCPPLCPRPLRATSTYVAPSGVFRSSCPAAPELHLSLCTFLQTVLGLCFFGKFLARVQDYARLSFACVFEHLSQAPLG